MSYYNTTYAYNSLSFITSKLCKPISKYLVYGNNYVLNKESYKNKFVCNCWKSKVLFNKIYLNNMNIGNMVFSLNFEINKNSIYISDIKISDDYYDNIYTGNIKRSYNNDVFNIDDIINNYIIKYHTDEEINKITININNNLDKYSEELDKLGFVLNLTSYSGKLEKIIKDKINNNNNKINNNNNDSPII